VDGAVYHSDFGGGSRRTSDSQPAQRISLLIAISASAYFLAHTAHKPKASSAAAVAAPDPRIGSLEQEVSSLRAQQQKLLDQQSAAEEEKKRRKRIRVKLGEFLGQGQQLMVQCGNEQSPAPEDAANKWAERQKNFWIRNWAPNTFPAFVVEQECLFQQLLLQTSHTEIYGAG